MVTQSQWRIWGAISLLFASAMALYAVVTDVLRHSVMLVVATRSEEVAEAASEIKAGPLILFWGLFAVLIVLALFLAAFDMRYIRLQYAEERRTILRRTLQDESFRAVLRDRMRPRDGARPDGE